MEGSRVEAVFAGGFPVVEKADEERVEGEAQMGVEAEAEMEVLRHHKKALEVLGAFCGVY